MTTRLLHRPVRGFTLLEVVVALFLFTLMMMAVAMILASGFKNYREGRLLAQNAEDAQVALNSIAKVLRTSTVKSSDNSNASSIEVYDYSQSKCVRYSFSSTTGRLNVEYGDALDGSGNPDPDGSCQNYSAPVDLLAGYVTDLSFDIRQSRDGDPDPRRVGRVVMSVTVRAGPTAVAGRRSLTVQTAASLHDYVQSGFY